jgi:hypothetical protein
MIINAASSCWSGLPIEDAVEKIVSGQTFEPLFGTISGQHIQICPQHVNYFSEAMAEKLADQYQNTQFRLHADVRLKNKRGYTVDLSDFSEDTEWYFREVASLSRKLNSKVYSLHAGKRKVSLIQFKEQYLKAQEIFDDVTLCVEGLYPASMEKWLIDKWDEYAWLAENNIPYAIDLSHLKIVTKRYGKNNSLVNDLIANHLCHEVHLSFNDGNLDSHEIAGEKFSDEFEKYKGFLSHKNSHSVIFTEGNQVLHEIRQKKLMEKSL